MDGQNVVGLVASIVIVIYLLWALTHPEKL